MKKVRSINTHKTKVTVVVPTRDRPDTLEKCLKTAVNQDYPNLEIIVSDNFSGPTTSAVVRSFRDPRIRYINTGKRVSMSHNFEFGISQVTEGWIVVLGDDDGLLPNSLGRVVDLLEQSGLEALASITCAFSWPSSASRKAGGSILAVPVKKGERIASAKEALTRLMDWRMHSLIFPQLYTGGMVSADLFKRISAVRGSFFQSQIPDVYSGFAICSVIDRYIFTHEPFAITGGSHHSTGAALFKMEHSPFLDEDNIPFHPSIPSPEKGTITISLPAVVYESYLQSAYLRDNHIKVLPADRLELILNQAAWKHTRLDKHKLGLLNEWGKLFASHHNLNYKEISDKAKKTLLRRRLSLFRLMLDNLKDRYRIDGSYGLAINDVFEASLVASTVLKTRPSRLGSYQRTLRRLLKRGVKSCLEQIS